jgi:hypothetical protein
MPCAIERSRRFSGAVGPIDAVKVIGTVQDALVCRFLHDRLGGRGGLPLGSP